MDKNKDFLRELKRQIENSELRRPTRDEAINAIYVAKFNLQHILDELNDIFNRENEFRLNQEIYATRKSELDKIDSPAN